MNITQILLSTKDYLNKIEGKRIKKFLDEYTINPQKVENVFFSAINSLFYIAKEKQIENKKGKVKYICFSFLYSNVLLDKYALRIDLYDENLWCDDYEVAGEWDISYFFEDCKNDFRKAMSILSSDYIKVTPYEEKILYRSYIYDYYAMSFIILKLMISKITELDNFKLMDKEKEIIVTLGEYMDRSEEIYRISK